MIECKRNGRASRDSPGSVAPFPPRIPCEHDLHVENRGQYPTSRKSLSVQYGTLRRCCSLADADEASSTTDGSNYTVRVALEIRISTLLNPAVQENLIMLPKLNGTLRRCCSLADADEASSTTDGSNYTVR